MQGVTFFRRFYESAIMVSANAATAWSSSGYKQRELIQKIIFPEGVYYDLVKQSFRTTRVNLAIAPIPQLDSVSGGIKDRQEAYYGLLSSQVGWTGFEPAIIQAREPHRGEDDHGSI